MDAKVFGAYIAKLRKEKHMTQSQLAEKIHVTDKAVSKWERGIGLPDITNIEALAETFDITLAELIQCKKQDNTSIESEEVNHIISTTFDISNYQKRILYQRIILGLLFATLGAVLLFVGIHYLLFPQTVIGGADGPTSVFIAGKISSRYPIAATLLGCFCLLAGLWQIFHEKP